MAQVRKALVAMGFVFAGTLGGFCSDGSVTVPEAVISLGAGLTAGYGVWKVKNAASGGEHLSS